MTSKETIALFCLHEVEKIKETDSFVSVRSLAKHFHADIIARPLLVEAMLASETQDAPDTPETLDFRWKVLVDSERFLVTDAQISNEASTSPLPVRLRNTIAHEIMHSFSFRTDEFRANLRITPRKNESKSDFIKRIEAETETLSPLLLVPHSSIVMLSRENILSIESILQLRGRCAVSREVLINRFKLLSVAGLSDVRYRTCLENVAIGLGEWSDSTTCQWLNWPLFVNFTNYRPSFVNLLNQRPSLNPREIISDKSFYLNGGTSLTVELDSNTGPKDPQYLRMRVKVDVEAVPRVKGSRFMFVVSRI